MRIRKRQVPLPFSSISPLSDPNFNRPPVTVVQLPLRQQQPPPPPATTPCSDDPHYYPFSKSDHANQPIGQPLQTQARDSSALHGQQLTKNTQDYLALNPGGDEEKNNDSRKSAKLGSGSSSSHYQGIGRWGEGEKGFPLKKRRGSVEARVDDDMMMAKETSNKKPMKSKNMKTKLNKKLVCDNEDESKDIGCTNVDNDSAKKRGRGGALMEGSRCSRVNGRGWRCCQQTLVGYSLCEHHLGKGRLRSISSVRNRAKEERHANNMDIRDHQGPASSNSSQQTKTELQHHNDEGEEQKAPLMVTKKRVLKLGMVKARSMSSLMGQNDNADDDN